MSNPKLRFKREDGTDYPEWKELTTNEVLQTITDYVAAGSFADIAKNVQYQSEGYAQLVRTVDLKNQFTSKEEIFVSESAFNYLWRVNLDKECIVMPNVGNCGEIYYVTPDILPYEHNVLGPNAIVVRSETVNNRFIAYLMESDGFQEQLKLIVSPSGQTKFNKTEFKRLFLQIPCLEEQQKIADFLSTVDEVIAQSEAEVQNLEQQKKAAMQKIFSQEVRFKREDGTEYPEWVEKKLGELVTSANKDKVNTSQYKKITIGLHKRGLSYSTVHEDMADTRPFYRRYEGELIIGKQNYFNGSIAIVSDEFDGCICSNAIMSFIFNSCVNGRFLYEAISRDTYLIYHSHLAEGGGQKELSEKKFLEMTVVIPSDIEEQQKIADFLSAYDEAISYAKLELEHWKQLKKGLLQQMFV